ncbi:hypothetical protein [Xanthobacter flavus]
MDRFSDSAAIRTALEAAAVIFIAGNGGARVKAEAAEMDMLALI